MNWIWITLTVIGLFLARSIWRIVRYLPRARHDISKLRADDLTNFAAECEGTFAAKFQIDLSTKSSDEALAAIDQGLRQKNAWESFRERGQPTWRYAMVTGSYLGELVRKETGAGWEFSAGNPPALKLQRGDASFTADPFERILKHHIHGMDGDLTAWFTTIRVVTRRIHQEGTTN